MGRADFQVKVRGVRIELGEIENTLLACPQVARAAVAVHHGDAADHLIAYVALDRSSTADHEAEAVDQWQHIYDELYDAELGAQAEAEFGSDFRGWNSSYTGEPIPLPQMQEWRSATVDRILALQAAAGARARCRFGADLVPGCPGVCGVFGGPTSPRRRSAS